MTRHKPHEPAPRVRLRNHIWGIIKTFRSETSPPAVIDRFMDRLWPNLYRDDQPLIKDGFLEGLGRIVRGEMHAYGAIIPDANVEGDDGVDPEQLSLDIWSEDEREIARQIGVPTFYVPSRGTYVALHDPTKISVAELGEGIEHLRKYSRQLDHRAQWGERLLIHRKGKGCP
jgi:hypothetical protein